MRSVDDGKEHASASANHDTERRYGMMRRSLPPVLAAFVLALVLAACGMEPTPPPSPPPTRLPPTVSATPIATPQPTPLPVVTPTSLPAPTPTLFPTTNGGAACGLIEIRDGTIANPAATATAEECFWQAYQRCAITDQLDVVQTSITTPNYSGATYSLKSPGSIGNPGGQCAVQVSTGNVHVIRDPTTGTLATSTLREGAYTGDFCRGMSRDSLGDLLFIGCGQGQKWDLMAP